MARLARDPFVVDLSRFGEGGDTSWLLGSLAVQGHADDA